MRLFIFIASIIIAGRTYTQEDEYLIREFKNHKDAVKAVVFSKSGNYLATSGEDKSLYIIDVASWEKLYEHKDNYYPVVDMEFYGDNQLFVTAGDDIKLIDLENNTLAVFTGNSTNFWSLDYAPERQLLIGGSYDRKIEVWDIHTKEIKLLLEGHEKSALAVAFSPDEKYVVSGSLDLSIRVWNAKTGEQMHVWQKHSENIYDIKFHPNPRYFASASGDKTVRLWDIQEGKVVKTYIGHDADVLEIEFSPDGYFLYTASLDGVVYIYEVRTGAKLYSYNSHVGPVNDIAVSNDGRYVATAGNDSKVYLWNSAKQIAVEYYYGDDFQEEKSTNPIFEPRGKGESKESYAERMKEGKAQLNELVDKYFEKYMKKNNNRNVPD